MLKLSQLYQILATKLNNSKILVDRVIQLCHANFPHLYLLLSFSFLRFLDEALSRSFFLLLHSFLTQLFTEFQKQPSKHSFGKERNILKNWRNQQRDNAVKGKNEDNVTFTTSVYSTVSLLCTVSQTLKKFTQTLNFRNVHSLKVHCINS